MTAGIICPVYCDSRGWSRLSALSLNIFNIEAGEIAVENINYWAEYTENYIPNNQGVSFRKRDVVPQVGEEEPHKSGWNL